MDMEKRLIIAVALSVLIYMVFTWLSPRPEAPLPQTVEPGIVESAETPAPTEPRDEAPLEAEAEPVETPAVVAESEERITVTNGVFEVVLTNRGGRVQSWKLQHFTTADGEPLELVPRYTDESALPLALELDDAILDDEINGALYRVERRAVPSGDGQTGGERITFTWSDGRGLRARKSLTFREGDYLVDLDVQVEDRGRRRPVRVAVGPGFGAQESSDSHSNYYYESQVLWNAGGQVTRRKARKLDDPGGLGGGVRWVGMEDQYFATLLLPGDERSDVRWRKSELVPILMDAEDSDDEVKPEQKPIVSVGVSAEGVKLFVGPKKWSLLLAMGSELDKAIWFSSMAWLRPIVKYLFRGLIWLHDHVTGNWGLAIVLATVILRLVLFPVNQYSMVSMKKSQLQMQRLQPKIKSIRNKYKKAKDAQSRAKMNQEMMDLYKKEGVNPMGGVTGCLPLLAQFPILIGFYNMLTVAVELRGAPFFGWIHDLSQADPFYITPVLMAGTMFAQQKLAMTKVKDPQQLQQQRIMLFMPLMFGYFCLYLPSGLVLYWFINNLLGIGQQWLVNRHTGRLEAAAQKA